MHLGKAVRSATSARASPANRETGYFSLTSTCVDTRQDAWKSCLSPYLPRLLAWFALGRHEEPHDDLPSDDVLLHDFCHVRLGAGPVPDALRVHDDAGSVFAVIQAAGLVRPDDSFEA